MHDLANSTSTDLALRKALADYLGRHPHAADSLEGIRQWWLPDSFRTVPTQQLKQALEQLITTGGIRRSTLPDGRELYAGAPSGTRQEQR